MKRNFSAFIHPPRLYLPTKLVRIIPYLLSHPQTADISKNDQHFSPSDVIVEAVRPEIQPADNLPLPVKFSSPGKLADFDQRPKNVVIVSASNVQAPVWIYYQVKVLFREMIDPGPIEFSRVLQSLAWAKKVQEVVLEHE